MFRAHAALVFLEYPIIEDDHTQPHLHFSTPDITTNLTVYFSGPFLKKLQWRPELLGKNLLSIEVVDHTKSQCLFWPSIAFFSSLVMEWIGWVEWGHISTWRIDSTSPWQKWQIFSAAGLLQRVQWIALITCCMVWRMLWGRNSGVCTQCLDRWWLASGDRYLSCCPNLAVCTELISFSQWKLNSVHLEVDATLTTWMF